jgi:hypothetical protein
VSSFHSGIYDNWQVSGNVLITITKLTGANAVVSGLFIDGATTGSPGLVIRRAVHGDGEHTSVLAYGTSDWSNPNPAGNRGSFPANVPRIVSPIAGGSSSRSAISPGGTELDLALEALPAHDNVPSLSADTSTRDQALEQVSEDTWARRVSGRWGTGGKESRSTPGGLVNWEGASLKEGARAK